MTQRVAFVAVFGDRQIPEPLNQLPQHGQLHLLERKANPIQGYFRLSTHGIDIAQALAAEI